MMNNVSKASQSITNVMGGLNQKLEKGSFDVDILFRENLMPLHQTLQELQVLLNETQGFVSNLKDSPSDLLFKEETIQPAPNER